MKRSLGRSVTDIVKARALLLSALVALVALPWDAPARGRRAPRRGERARPAAVQPAPAEAAEAAGPVELAYPLGGPAEILPTFGEKRGGGRRHEGVDMMAAKRTPVFAAADGVIAWAHDARGGKCCDLEIRHDDGWRTRYIHLDNDTPGTDDGKGVGIADGVSEGARVVRGQLIGWVGDSGNAEECAPHLHFELRRPDHAPVDPLGLLRELQGLPRGTTLPHGK